ncbi:MAG: ferrochelatase [Candidatus Acidiferrales bacterium]
MTVSKSQDRWGVLLLAHGAPDSLDDIPEFLLNVRNGRPLPPPVVEEIKHRYALIGGGSPLLGHSRRQAELLAARLERRVYLAMRNWHPFIAEVVPQIIREGAQGLVVLCLAPHNSRTSVGLYRRRLEEALSQAGASLAVRFVEHWHDNPALIQAFAERLRAALAAAEAAAGSPVPVILTAHSVPERTIAAGDPYDSQVRETVALVAEAAGCQRWQAAYQSQGMTSEPWIGPTVESAIAQLAAAGQRHVLIAPVGFLCDHVEILYDVDIAFRDYARGKGVTLHRTESLNDSPLLIEALASVVSAELAVAATKADARPLGGC